jgi:hypothetical protein
VNQVFSKIFMRTTIMSLAVLLMMKKYPKFSDAVKIGVNLPCLAVINGEPCLVLFAPFTFW